MSSHQGETTARIDTTQPTIDDFRDLAAERGTLPDGVVDVDSFEYPVSERTWDDIDETTSPVPRSNTPRSASFELEQAGHYIKATLTEAIGHPGINIPITSGDHALVLGNLGEIAPHALNTSGDLLKLTRELHVPAVPIAFTASNCIVYDPAFEYGELEQTIGPVDTLAIPREVFEDLPINPTQIELIDKTGDDAVFHDGENFYFRGGDIRDGWVGQLDMRVSTVEEAKQEALRPDAVIAAAQQGRDVHRQGDWFFVETDDEPSGLVRHPDVAVDGEDTQLGNHIAEWQGIKIDAPPRVFVKGTVEHLTDDHDDLSLHDWHEAINNGIDAYSYETTTMTPTQAVESVGMADETAVRDQSGVTVTVETGRNVRHRSQNTSSTRTQYD